MLPETSAPASAPAKRKRIAGRLPAMTEQKTQQRLLRRRDIETVQTHQRIGAAFEPLMLLIGKPQIIAKPLRIFGKVDAKRRQSQQRVGRIVRAKPQQPLQPRRPRRRRNERTQQPRFGKNARDLAGAARDEEFEEFRANSFARKLQKSAALGHGRMQSVRVQRPFRIIRRETKEAQDAQIIFANAFRRIADEAQPVRVEIGKAADIIIEHGLAVHRQSVDRKIAPLGIGARNRG